MFLLQDTIVALDGLTKYAQQTRTDSLALDIDINALDEAYAFKITDQDRLKSRQLPLKTLAGHVGLGLTGTGCALAQVQTAHLCLEPGTNRMNFS